MRFREGVRALILDPEDHVLLVHVDWDGLDVDGGLWANPGGGVEPGESRLSALRRELQEEVGLTVEALGPEVFVKTAVFAFADWDGQVDHIHLVRTQRFDPRPAMSHAELAAENIRGVRWWSPEEIDDSAVTFAPRDLARLLYRLRTEGVPTRPIELSGF